MTTSDARTPIGSGRRVLVVDDDARFLAEMQEQLGEHVQVVLVARTPLEAIWIMEHERVDAIVSDLILGSADGLDLLDEVRRRWPEVARVLLTGYGDRLVGEPTGPVAQAVVAKPCEVSRLAALLLGLVADHRVPAPVGPALAWRAVQMRPGVAHVGLAGEITEASMFVELGADVAQVIFDLAGVKRINSSGVHRLLRFLEQLALEGREIEAIRCSPAVVAQLNLIPRLAQLLPPRSVLVPMDCPACDSASDLQVDIRGPGRPRVPDVTCPACGAPMEPGSPLHLYLAFLDG